MGVIFPHNTQPLSPWLSNVSKAGVGRAMISHQPWICHETKHTNWTVQISPKNPCEFFSLVSPSSRHYICSFSSCWQKRQALLPANTIWSAAELIFHLKIKLWARSSLDLKQLSPIRHLMVWPFIKIILPLSLKQEHNQRVRFWSDVWRQWKYCFVSDASIRRNYNFFPKASEKHAIQKKQKKERL